MKPVHPCYRTIGPNIRRARLAAGLKQREVADAIGCARSVLCTIEAGRLGVSIPRLVELAFALGVTPASLLEGAGGPTDVLCGLIQEYRSKANAHPNP